MSQKRIMKDIFDKNQNKWIQGEIIDNKYVSFKGWSEKWNMPLENIPDRYIKKIYTHTKRFRPQVGDFVQIKIKNVGKENIYDFRKIFNDVEDKFNYCHLIKYGYNTWSNGIIIKKNGKFVSVIYTYNRYVCIIKVKKDSNVICEKNTHKSNNDNNNIFVDIFVRINNFNKIKYFGEMFLFDLKIKENINDYFELDFVISFILDNIHYFEDEDQKISFLKMILFSNKFKKRCYFELAHLYMNKKDISKKLIFRYLCLSDNTNIAVKYIQDKICIENNSNDPIDILYDLLI